MLLPRAVADGREVGLPGGVGVCMRVGVADGVADAVCCDFPCVVGAEADGVAALDC